MAIDDCIEVVSHRLVKLEDKKSKRTLIVSNPTADKLSRVRMDGCVLKQVTAADWLVSKQQVGDLIVELKGSDIAQAIRQVHAVAAYLEANSMRQGKLGAVVLCTRFPQSDSTILRLRNAFAKAFAGSPLHIASRDCRVDFVESISKHDAALDRHP